MTARALDAAVVGGRLAQMTQLRESYDSKTDQTAQTDQRFESAKEFDAPRDPELTSRHPKLTSETARRPDSRAREADTPSSHGRRQDGAPQP